MNMKKIGAAVLASAVVAAASVAVTASGDSPHARTGAVPASAYPADPGALAQFSAMSAAPTAADQLPASLHPESLPVAASTARRIVSSDSVNVWATGNEKMLCISVLSTAGAANAACNATTSVVAGFALVTGDARSGSVLVSGIVPDGARDVVVEVEQGPSVPAKVTGNGFAVPIDGATVKWSFTDADGRERSQLLKSFDR